MNEEPADDVILKPCPFCGGEADVSEGTQGGHEARPWWYVECIKCAAMADSVDAWNSRTAPEAAWKTIDTAPLGKMVWLWHRAWRHPFPGQCVNLETGMSVIDTCTARATTWDTHATHWREMDLPPGPQGER